MKCRFCKKNYTSNLNFSSLFTKDCTCTNCQAIRKANLLFECIPYQLGMIYYYYFSDSLYLDPVMDNLYNAMIDKPLNLAISQRNDFDLIMFIDIVEFQNFPKWRFILNLFKKVMFVSNNRFEFEIFVMLF